MYYYCGRQEAPALVIFRLSLRVRRMYVASIRLDARSSRSFGPPITSNLITRILTRETCARHNDGAKAL